MPITSKYYAERKKPTNINTKQNNHKKDLKKKRNKNHNQKNKNQNKKKYKKKPTQDHITTNMSLLIGEVIQLHIIYQ